MLLNEKKAKIRELTNNGPVPEARIPDSPEIEPEVPTKPKRGAKAIKEKQVKSAAAKPAARNKRKRPTPEPELEPEPHEDEPMDDASATEEEERVQGNDDRDADVERAFGMRNDEDDATEDEGL